MLQLPDHLLLWLLPALPKPAIHLLLALLLLLLLVVMKKVTLTSQ
jgi:hypothetical protein